MPQNLCQAIQCETIVFSLVGRWRSPHLDFRTASHRCQDSPATKRRKVAEAGKRIKLANSIINKVSGHIGPAESLASNPNFRLLHEETTKKFREVLSEAQGMVSVANKIIATNGEDDVECCDLSTASKTASDLKKSHALMTHLLQSLSKVAVK